MIGGPINNILQLICSETCWVTLYILFIKIIDNLQLSKIKIICIHIGSVRPTLSDHRTVVSERIAELIYKFRIKYIK